MMGASQRRGRGKSAKSLELVRFAKEILEEIQPATVRAVCYRLFVAGQIPDMSTNNTQRVSSQLVWGREQGIIPWEWIVDETREAERIAAWDNPEGIIGQAVRQYRKDYWSEQPNHVEVWSEKGTVRGTLAPVLKEYGVTFRVMHGFTSATSIFNVASDSVSTDKPLTAFYVGDWDPSGLYMSEVDLPERMSRYGGEANIIRVALTSEDTTGDLPGFDADSKRKDPRYRWFVSRYGIRCWELDALPPPELRERVADAIRDLIDFDAWGHAIEVERVEVESMTTLLDSYRQSISRQVGK